MHVCVCTHISVYVNVCMQACVCQLCPLTVPRSNDILTVNILGAQILVSTKRNHSYLEKTLIPGLERGEEFDLLTDQKMGWNIL